METTIELPNDLRQKLIAKSAERNLRGFSPIIIEALNSYFKKMENDRKKEIQSLKGCLNDEEYVQELKRVNNGRENWRI